MCLLNIGLDIFQTVAFSLGPRINEYIFKLFKNRISILYTTVTSDLQNSKSPLLPGVSFLVFSNVYITCFGSEHKHKLHVSFLDKSISEAACHCLCFFS